MQEGMARWSFSTADIDPKLRAKIYARWLRPMARVQFSDTAAIHASLSMLSVGDVTVALAASSPARYLHSVPITRRSGASECVLVQLVIKGSVYADLGHKSIDVSSGDIYLLDLGSHCEAWVDDVECVQLLIPRAYLHKVVRSIHGRTLRQGSLAGRMLAEQLTRCAALLRSKDGADADRVVHATIDLIVQALSAALDRSGSEEMGDGTRDAVLGYIEEHLSSPELASDQLAMIFGLSRAKLYRLFTPLGGIQHYIRDRRLDAVLKDICQSPALSISEAARRYGFSNERQFQRAFRARFGITAKDARAGWRPDLLSQTGRS